MIANTAGVLKPLQSEILREFYSVTKMGIAFKKGWLRIPIKIRGTRRNRFDREKRLLTHCAIP